MKVIGIGKSFSFTDAALQIDTCYRDSESFVIAMPVAKAKQELGFQRLGLFATSKLIQNLGSNREQYKQEGKLRGVYGRD